ncbi:MAG: sigma factor-like helix-turn-helix DNA-binding protein [Myxococcota bacterium]
MNVRASWEVVPADEQLTPVVEDPRKRPKTMSRREMLRERRRRERAGETVEVLDYDRPKVRSECKEGPRPCLFVSCKHHLYLDVNPETGSVKLNFPDKEVWELEETCALDVAERGGITLEEVGEILNLTRERIRQLEVTALQKMKEDAPKYELDAFIGWDPRRDDIEP